MKTTPMLFSGPMVRAILAGHKTQTRRIVKPPPLWVYDESVPVRTPDADPKGAIKCPYGRRSDLIWVRETWAGEQGDIRYRADGDSLHGRGGGKWLPSIFMPRWASRLTLEITEVRVERVQGISEEDARAEGVRGDAGGVWGCEGLLEDFADVWDRLNAKRGSGWEEDPWVWVLTFKVHRCNVDQLMQRMTA